MGNWIIDQTHSTISFEVTHLMVSKVRGQFDSFTAEVDANHLPNLKEATVSFSIDAESINTFNRERDQHLKSADFFDIARYPIINFTSTEMKQIERSNQYKLTGDLTIKGITNEVTFDVTFGGKVVDPSGVEVLGYEAEVTIDREKFGLLWNAVLEAGGVLVGKEVTIKVSLELRKEQDVSLVPSGQINQPFALKERVTSTEYFHQLIAENLTDLVVITDQKGNLHYITPSLNEILGYDEASFQQKNFYENIHPDEKTTIREQIVSQSIRKINNTVKSDFHLLHEKGHYIQVEADIIYLHENDFIMLVIRDIGERKEAEKAIYQLAFHDSLTELPNRRSFFYQLRNEMMEADSSTFSIFFIDLDDFKGINDKLGHNAGDIALKEAAERICSVIDSRNIAARFGGDEFVVLIKDVPSEAYIITIAERLLEQFEKPIDQLGEDCFLTPSIGIANYPEHGDSPEELIKNADRALYQVKERSKNDFMIFNEVIKHQSLERQILENALRKGFKEEQFYLEYQPKVNITTNEVIGMEALVRWHHPELGIIPPGKFIPLAEETGLIVPLGEWILKESCRQAAKWQEMDYPPLTLSVNISVRQLEDIHFIEKVKTVLEETGMNPNRLELEITESVLANIKSTLAVLKEIRKLGVRISVDDFGTGYSSLSYIKELPIDTIKIDQSFVKDIHHNKESKEIAKALINLANSIGLNAIAEGIEQKEHVETLSKDGYILGQGFYYSKPLKPEAFEEFVEEIHDAS